MGLGSPVCSILQKGQCGTSKGATWLAYTFIRSRYKADRFLVVAGRFAIFQSGESIIHLICLLLDGDGSVNIPPMRGPAHVLDMGLNCQLLSIMFRKMS